MCLSFWRQNTKDIGELVQKANITIFSWRFLNNIYYYKNKKEEDRVEVYVQSFMLNHLRKKISISVLQLIMAVLCDMWF
jgi:hypothetical protein